MGFFQIRQASTFQVVVYPCGYRISGDRTQDRIEHHRWKRLWLFISLYRCRAYTSIIMESRLYWMEFVHVNLSATDNCSVVYHILNIFSWSS
jgi:hypothetical protein